MYEFNILCKSVSNGISCIASGWNAICWEEQATTCWNYETNTFYSLFIGVSAVFCSVISNHINKGTSMQITCQVTEPFQINFCKKAHTADLDVKQSLTCYMSTIIKIEQCLTPCLALSSLYCPATSLKRIPDFIFSIASIHLPCFSQRMCRTWRGIQRHKNVMTWYNINKMTLQCQIIIQKHFHLNVTLHFLRFFLG